MFGIFSSELKYIDYREFSKLVVPEIICLRVFFDAFLYGFGEQPNDFENAFKKDL